MFQFQLDNAQMISPRVKHFVLSSTEADGFMYLPGQFITIHFEHQGKTIRRSYSIANPPTGDHRIEFAASYVESGPGSEYLFQLKPGDILQVSGPFGRLVLKEPAPKRYILLATSTGVTPYRAMIPALQQHLDAHPDASVVIFEGVQKQAEVLYTQDFLDWAARNPRVLFRAYLSRETLTEPSAHIRYGHVQAGFDDLNLRTRFFQFGI